jgi:hypothetical protein
LALLALAAAWSLILGGTLSAYTATTATSAGSLAAAADWVAPTASTAVVGRSTATDTGSIAQGSTYYLYANASDTGNPASGITSVSANLNSISAGKTAVALTAGTYSAGGGGVADRREVDVDVTEAGSPDRERRGEDHRLVALADQPGQTTGHVRIGGDQHAGGVELGQQAEAAEDQTDLERVGVRHDARAHGAPSSSASLSAATSPAGGRQANTPHGVPSTIGVGAPTIPRRNR